MVRVQLDDAYLGGERSGGKAGPGSENKVPFVAALSLDENGGPTYLKLDVVSGFTSQAIGERAKTRLKPGCVVLSDGLGCFAAVTEAGCVHIPRVVGTLKPKDLPELKWINTVLGNLKTTLAGLRTLSASAGGFPSSSGSTMPASPRIRHLKRAAPPRERNRVFAPSG
jgi:hypothetical protein